MRTLGRTSVTRCLALLALWIVGCGRTPDVEVNRSFEMTPPIARSVEVRKVGDDQVLVVADFGTGTLATRYHAVEIESEKIVLRDDGRDGDERANDGRFSVRIREDVSQFTAMLDSVDRAHKMRPAMMPARFSGRELLPPEPDKQMRLDLDAFKSGRPIRLDWWLICPLLLDVSIDHSLMVTNVAVVEDANRTNRPCDTNPNPPGAWSFGTLMADMANQAATGVSTDEFVKAWLATWLADATVNSDPVPARPTLFNRVIQPWSQRSNPGQPITLANWQSLPLDMRFAPFKLTAIVNRLDLRGNMGYGFANSGEGRFVFEVMGMSANPNVTQCGPLSFTVIFEYGLPIHSCKAVRDYAQKWYDLKALPFGGAYNDQLQDITDVFAKINADPSKPNGSALNQIRTNEIALAGPWELREFNIDPATHKLALTTVKQEPAKKYNAKAAPAGAPSDVTLMANWVNANEAAVIADQHTVPITLSTSEPFLGGKSHTEFGGFWDAAPMEITNEDARHHFSLNTCSGCHGGETATSFLQVGTASFGTEAQLAGFLTGITVNDPAGRPTPASPKQRTFDDLLRRQQSLEQLLCTQCRSKLFDLVTALQFKPVHMTH